MEGLSSGFLIRHLEITALRNSGTPERFGSSCAMRYMIASGRP